MKNLSLWDVCVRDFPANCENNFCMCYGHDEDRSDALYVCDSNLVLRCFGENGKEKWNIDLTNKVSPDNRAVNVTCLSLLGTVCVGMENGELLTITDCGAAYQLAGICEAGIQAMEWSPDQELLTLVTNIPSMVLMSCTLDPIQEVQLVSEEFGEKQFITVGWGKKETQFHGKEGKGARVKSEVEPDPQISDNAVKISWRGDGHLYAIGFAMEGIRRFKVFDREGHLQYTSEKQPGLESNIAWRPSGNVIATTQRLPDKYVVAFFEKNGLKHGGFDIPVDASVIVQDITWSSDSEILMLQCKDTVKNTQNLLLFTMANYHWYLKQNLVFNQRISKNHWDDGFNVTNQKKLHIILDNGRHYLYTWIWNINHSVGKTEDDDAVVAVIDGKKILVTGFRQTVVPPPMAALDLHSESLIDYLCFAQHLDSNSFIAITSDQKVIMYEQTQKFPLQYKEAKILALDKYDFPFQYYNWFWLNENTLLCVMIDSKGSHNIVEYSIDSEKLVKKVSENLPAPVVRIESNPVDRYIAFLQLNNGELMHYQSGGDMEPSEVSFCEPCPKFKVLSMEDKLRFIGLSQKGHLYIDDAMIMSGVSSFFVHTHFLLLTTLEHMLLSTELSDASLSGLIEYNKNVTENIYKRKIERGAKLVIAVPKDTRTVFQMPRGNLETIQPRPLSLKIIGTFLDSLKYYEAFDLMRKQRINLNLIYDHDPDKFVKNIDVFLESIKNNSWLSLFLSDLENVDVTKTMYSSSYNQNRTQQDSSSKITRICELIRSNLSLRPDTDNRILPFLTSFVKTNTVQDLEKALSLIKDIKKRESTESKLPISSDEALKYLLYMVNVDTLFDIALGMYDFDLVLLVANKSQKDPKEFIPMLNELNEMEENYKRFSINKHLKRFDKAVQFLIQCGAEKHEELKTFVKYHSLYKEALSLLPQKDEVYRQISEDYGQYLRLKKQFTEAGIVFERGNNFDKAIECYKDALKWELAVNLAQKWPQEQFQGLCLDLVNGLKEEKRHREALIILEQYHEDKVEAIRYAIEAGQYRTAIRLCTTYNKQELKETTLLPALEEDHRNLLELVQTNYTTFTHHRDRLKVVRETKSNITEYDHTYNNYNTRDSDLYSDAGSTLASSKGSSSRSYRSSKNRRKQERKVASLKEGSQYEDVALVMALHSLVTSSFELRTPVKEVLTALSCFGRDKEAFTLQVSLEKLLREMRESLRTIWTHELVLEAATAAAAASNVTEGAIPQGIAQLDPHLTIAPVITEVNWKLDGLF